MTRLQYANYTKAVHTRKEDIYQDFTFSGISIKAQTKLIAFKTVCAVCYIKILLFRNLCVTLNIVILFKKKMN